MAQDEVAYRVANWEDFLPHLDEAPSEEQVYQDLCQDSWWWQDQWGTVMERLAEVLIKHGCDGVALIEGRNLGWRGHHGGYHTVRWDEPGDLLRKMIPSDSTWAVYEDGDGLRLNCHHHDTRFAGLGGENHLITPVRLCGYCEEGFPVGEHTVDLACIEATDYCHECAVDLEVIMVCEHCGCEAMEDTLGWDILNEHGFCRECIVRGYVDLGSSPLEELAAVAKAVIGVEQ
jgi:hypothetical protein